MMKVMFDTNVLLDVFQQRNGFYLNSAQALNAIASEKAIGYIPASVLTDIFYIARKTTGDRTRAYMAVDLVNKLLQIADVSADDVKNAIESHAADFEDCVLANCAKSHECDYIITRNKKDYKSFEIPTLTPAEFIKKLP